jgi:hypothetical protein
MEPGLLNPIFFIQKERHFAVALHPGHGINDNAAKAFSLTGCFGDGGHGINPIKERESLRLTYRMHRVSMGLRLQVHFEECPGGSLVVSRWVWIEPGALMAVFTAALERP